MKGCGPCLGIGTSNIHMPRSRQRSINALLLVCSNVAIEDSEMCWRLNTAIDSSDTRSPAGVTRACMALSFTSPAMASRLHDNNLATSPGFFELLAGLERASAETWSYAPRSITNPPTVPSELLKTGISLENTARTTSSLISNELRLPQRTVCRVTVSFPRKEVGF
jgi:hypothetical protein